MTSPQYQRPDWTRVYFTADAEREPFEDVTIDTTKNKFIEVAWSMAADSLHRSGKELTPERVRLTALLLVASRMVFVQEQVIVDEQGIRVYIDVPSLDREDAPWRAIDLVGQALDQLNGEKGTVYFGERLKYPWTELPGRMQHD